MVIIHSIELFIYSFLGDYISTLYNNELVLRYITGLVQYVFKYEN